MIRIGRETTADFEQAIKREWLVTNGIGGFASGTITGANTRRYHALLCAALRPPVDRLVMLAKVDEELVSDGSTYYLGTNEYPGRTLPTGFVHLDEFTLDRGVASFSYKMAGIRLEKRIWMARGQNTTYLRYTLAAADAPITLTLRPLANFRDYHKLTTGANEWHFLFTPLASLPPELRAGAVSGGQLRAYPEAVPYYLLLDRQAEVLPVGVWYWNFVYRAEQERGLDYKEDLYAPCTIRLSLKPGESVTLVVSSEAPANIPFDGAGQLAAAQSRPMQLLVQARMLLPDDVEARQPSEDVAAALDEAHSVPDEKLGEVELDVRGAERFATAAAPRQHRFPIPNLVAGFEQLPPIQQPLDEDGVGRLRTELIEAADQFIVARRSASIHPTVSVEGAEQQDSGVTVIAGYPWFTDWGRDTMIALPGLCLETGRLAEAASILRTFARHVDQGMLPNFFPDADQTPEYNTVDATLWYFHAIEQHRQRSGSDVLARELYPTLAEIVRWHVQGTRYKIKVDARDGLLYAGEEGVQLTWMDAKAGDWVVTPRIGKPVEINALWHHALSIMARYRAVGMGVGGDLDYQAMADQAAASFRARYWYAEGSYLYDVIDGPAGDDASLRPNMLFACGLEPDLLTDAQVAAVLKATDAQLLTPYGLRTLAPSDPAYVGIYTGGREQRDGAYHQGTVWPWPLIGYAHAAYRLGKVASLHAVLTPFAHAVRDFGLGSVAEIYDGDAPHAPKGCFAQAWSVAALLEIIGLLHRGVWSAR